MSKAGEEHARVIDSGGRDGSMSAMSDHKRVANLDSRTSPAGGLSESARLAPNGKPSNLTAAEYARATSLKFKAEYGDWEALGHRQFLDGEPVKTLTGDEFKKDLDLGLTERVEKFFNEAGGKAVNAVIGEVLLGKSGIRDSLAHGIGRNKAAAFAAVPDIIEQGRVIGWQKDWKARGYDTVTIAAPIQIAGRDYVAVVVVRRTQGTQRFYLHEVGLKNALLEEAFKTVASAEKSGELNTAPPQGAIKRILLGIYAVNPESVKISLDENGEPRMPASR